jgi:hypothetical protein
MNKNILVIGEVTRNQYEAPRLEILRDGHTPKIIRVGADDFLLERDRLLARYATNEEHHEYKAASEADDDLTEDEAMDGKPFPSNAVIHRLAVRHLSSHSVIGAIVFDEKSWVDLSATANTYVNGAIDKLSGCTLWVARPGGLTEVVN